MNLPWRCHGRRNPVGPSCTNKGVPLERNSPMVMEELLVEALRCLRREGWPGRLRPLAGEAAQSRGTPSRRGRAWPARLRQACCLARLPGPGLRSAGPGCSGLPAQHAMCPWRPGCSRIETGACRSMPTLIAAMAPRLDALRRCGCWTAG